MSTPRKKAPAAKKPAKKAAVADSLAAGKAARAQVAPPTAKEEQKAAAPQGAAGGEQKQKAAPPSTSRQKSFIVENAGILDRQSKRDILSIAINEAESGVAMERAGGTDINLDNCGPECIERIYNLVKSRFDALNQPAH